MDGMVEHPITVTKTYSPHSKPILSVPSEMQLSIRLAVVTVLAAFSSIAVASPAGKCTMVSHTRACVCVWSIISFADASCDGTL